MIVEWMDYDQKQKQIEKFGDDQEDEIEIVPLDLDPDQ